MIKILVLSRSDLALWARRLPQEEFDKNELFHLAGPLCYEDSISSHYAIFQEGDGPVTVLKDRSDYPLKALLQEVIDNMV